MVAWVGLQGMLCRQPIFIQWNGLLLGTETIGRKRIRKCRISNFGICSWKTVPKRAVSFEVTPEVSKLTYPNISQGQALMRMKCCFKRPKKLIKPRKCIMIVNNISMTKLDWLLNKVYSNDFKLKMTNMVIKDGIEKLKMKLNQAITYTRNKRDLHWRLQNFKPRASQSMALWQLDDPPKFLCNHALKHLHLFLVRD